MDDRTVGLVLRALRRRRGLRQRDVAARAGCSQALVSNLERGHVGRSSVEAIRSVFHALDARLHLAPQWRGAELHRLLDADHAAIGETFAGRLDRAGWQALLEVTYAFGREQGSIDVLGLDPVHRAVLVAEIKSDIAAAEALGRKLDEKARLAPAIVRERFGWTPAVVGVVLVMPESPRLRRLLLAYPVLTRMFPSASREIAAWLREPSHPIAATWFLSGITTRNPRRVRAAPKRVSTPRPIDARPTLSTDSDDDEPPSRILRRA